MSASRKHIVRLVCAAVWCLQCAGSANAQTRPTYSEHIAPLVFERCVPCHRPEGSAPFSLLTYDDVRRRARQIALVTGQRVMPPWKATGERGEFAGDRRLTDDQIALFQSWAEHGAVEGDRGLLPPTPAWSGSWQLGPPDLVIEMPAYRLGAGGDDKYRNFVIPIPVPARRYIKAWQFLPSTPVVHHATLQFDRTGRSRTLDAADQEPGYEGLIAPSVQGPDGYFLHLGPGHTPYVAPEGMAWPLEPSTDLVMMLHLRPSGKEETVRAKLGLYFSPTLPTRVPSLIRLTRQHMDIAPGVSDYQVVDSYRLNVDVELHTIQPHAHYLAKAMSAVATLPDGRRKALITIPAWDFNWQGVYRYERPISLPAGTTITMEYVYDNSAANPVNPSSPPRRVTYGQRTSDEMAELFIQVTTKTAEDRAALGAAVRAKILREEIVGHEKMLEADSRNAALHDDVALLYAEAGDLERTGSHFLESLRLKPTSPEAHYNVGTALVMQGNSQAAADYFTRAIALKPDYGVAHESLARIAQAAGQIELALDRYERAADAFARAGDFDRARAVTRSALALAAADGETQRRLRQRDEAYARKRPY